MDPPVDTDKGTAVQVVGPLQSGVMAWALDGKDKMKIHTKKKAYLAALKELAKQGYAPRPDGVMVPKGQLPDNAMKRDYFPQK